MRKLQVGLYLLIIIYQKTKEERIGGIWKGTSGEPHPASPPGGGLRRATLPIFFENGEGSPTRVRWTWGGGSNSRGDAILSRFLDKIADKSGNKKGTRRTTFPCLDNYSTNVL